MVCVAWVFFRAESVGEAMEYLEHMGTDVLTWPEGNKVNGAIAILTMVTIEILIIRRIHIQNRPFQWLLYVIAVYSIYEAGKIETSFIYFQF